MPAAGVAPLARTEVLPPPESPGATRLRSGAPDPVGLSVGPPVLVGGGTAAARKGADGSESGFPGRPAGAPRRADPSGPGSVPHRIGGGSGWGSGA